MMWVWDASGMWWEWCNMWDVWFGCNVSAVSETQWLVCDAGEWCVMWKVNHLGCTWPMWCHGWCEMWDGKTHVTDVVCFVKWNFRCMWLTHDVVLILCCVFVFFHACTDQTKLSALSVVSSLKLLNGAAAEQALGIVGHLNSWSVKERTQLLCKRSRCFKIGNKTKQTQPAQKTS